MAERILPSCDPTVISQLGFFLSNGRADPAQLGKKLSGGTSRLAQLTDFLSRAGRHPSQLGISLSRVGHHPAQLTDFLSARLMTPGVPMRHYHRSERPCGTVSSPRGARHDDMFRWGQPCYRPENHLRPGARVRDRPPTVPTSMHAHGSMAHRLSGERDCYEHL